MNRLKSAIMATALSLGIGASASVYAVADPVSAGDAASVQTVIEDQLLAFKENDGSRAYSHAAPGIKQVFGSVDRFMAMVLSGYRPLVDPGSYTFGRSDGRDQKIAQELIVTDKAGKQWQAIYILEKQPDGSWKINGVKMNPYQGAST